MQPSAPFKLEQSLSTDGISNQSTTQARGGHTALMNLEGRGKKRYPKKKRQQKWSPLAVTHFTTGSSVSLSSLFENNAPVLRRGSQDMVFLQWVL